jgi:hypothetical protein
MKVENVDGIENVEDGDHLNAKGKASKVGSVKKEEETSKD